MNGPSEQPPLYTRWVEKADHDLTNAEHTLKLEDECPLDTVCFHAQQCAEKYLKALLCCKGISFPRTHDLRVLVQAALSVSQLKVDAEATVALNRYAVETRYPGDWQEIGRAEAVQAVETAKAVRSAVRAQLPEM